MDGLTKLRQSFDFFAFPDRAILGNYSRICKSFDGEIEIDIMLRNIYTIRSISMIE